jgi:hypothetical protein
MLRPGSLLALLLRTFTFELSPSGSPREGVEYGYVGNSQLPRPDFHRQATRHYGLHPNGNAQPPGPPLEP